MTPLEQLQKEKRSGLFDDTVEPAPVPAVQPQPTGQPEPAPMPPDQNEMASIIKIMYRDFDDQIRLTRMEQEKTNRIIWILAILLLALALVGGWFFYKESNKEPKVTTKVKYLKGKTRVVYKTKTKVKYETKYKTKVVKVIPKQYQVAMEDLSTARERIKILMAQSDDSSWRRYACKTYGDWNACRIYKENLPIRARVGRIYN